VGWNAMCVCMYSCILHPDVMFSSFQSVVVSVFDDLQ